MALVKMKNPITVFPRKKKPKKTMYDINKIQQHTIDILEKFSAVYRLSPLMRTLWEIVYKSGELITVQIKMLRERTGEIWYGQKYWKFRRRLEKELRR